MIKNCVVCGKEFESYRGVTKTCSKECLKVHSYLYKQTDEFKRRKSEQDRKYRENNKEELSKKKKEWRDKNIDSLKAKRKINYAINKDIYAQRCKEYKLKNEDRVKQYKAKYYQINKNKWSDKYKNEGYCAKKRQRKIEEVAHLKDSYLRHYVRTKYEIASVPEDLLETERILLRAKRQINSNIKDMQMNGMQLCCKCHKIKPLSEFHRNNNRLKHGGTIPYSTQCKVCVNKKNAELLAKKEKRFKKICIVCGREFNTNKAKIKTCSSTCSLNYQTHQNIFKNGYSTSNCIICGKNFVKTGTQITCSIKCRRVNRQNKQKISNSLYRIRQKQLTN